MESRLQENLKQKHENYIFPFFWQYEDGCQFMEKELEKIYESGAGAVCVESRASSRLLRKNLVEGYGYHYGICQNS